MEKIIWDESFSVGVRKIDEQHKEQHKEFRKKTVAFCMGTMAYKEAIATEILSYLKNWLVNHILKSDMKYKSFFNDKGLN
jgi:hemerythrin